MNIKQQAVENKTKGRVDQNAWLGMWNAVTHAFMLAITIQHIAVVL